MRTRGSDQRGILIVEYFWVLAFVALVTLVAIPQAVNAWRALRRHACAVELDRFAAGQPAQCPLTGRAYGPGPLRPGSPADAAGEICCPDPEAHHVDRFCVTPGGTPMAEAHPAPSPIRRWAWTVVACTPLLLVGLAFVGSLGKNGQRRHGRGF